MKSNHFFYQRFTFSFLMIEQKYYRLHISFQRDPVAPTLKLETIGYGL